jgi:hypothetical protein
VTSALAGLAVAGSERVTRFRDTNGSFAPAHGAQQPDSATEPGQLVVPSGAFRVRLYGGKDLVTGHRPDIVEVIPPGPKAAAQAEAARTRR